MRSFAMRAYRYRPTGISQASAQAELSETLRDRVDTDMPYALWFHAPRPAIWLSMDGIHPPLKWGAFWPVFFVNLVPESEPRAFLRLEWGTIQWNAVNNSQEGLNGAQIRGSHLWIHPIVRSMRINLGRDKSPFLLPHGVKVLIRETPQGELPRPEWRGFLLHGQHLHHGDVM